MVSWLDEALEPVTQSQISMEDEYPKVLGPTEAVTQPFSSAIVYVTDDETRQVLLISSYMIMYLHKLSYTPSC